MQDWSDSGSLMTESQTEGILDACSIEVVTETSTHFMCYCPWHGNTDSPALAVDKFRGVYFCHNPTCAKTGTLEEMIRTLLKMNTFQALRLIAKKRTDHSTPFADRIKEALEVKPEFVEFPQDVLDRMYEDFPGSIAQEYMRSRGFEDETMDYFRVGYSAKKGMVIVPMHDPDGMPIGLIGRTPSHTDKRFKNSTKLPKSKTAWNFHRAKRTGDTVIVVEASYDAMRIHQAGYPNVIALLGGSVTAHHLKQIGRHFSKVIIMTDFDNKQYPPNCNLCRGIKFKLGETPCLGHRPGRDLGRQLVKGLPGKKVMWGAYDDSCVFPHGAKDASDMTDDEIRQCLKGAVSNLEYIQWNPEETLASV